jgi:hypothetical protein
MQWTVENGKRIGSVILLGPNVEEQKLHHHTFKLYHDATPPNAPEGVKCSTEVCKCGATRCIVTGPEEVLQREFAI